MKKLWLLTALVFVSTTLFARPVPVKVIGSHPNKARLSRVINDRLVKNSSKRYRKVSAKVIKNRPNSRELLVNLVSEDTYRYEVVKMVVSKDDLVKSVVRNFKVTDLVLTNPLACPDETVDVVYATPCDDIATAVAGVQDACSTAQSAGLKCKTLIGSQATVMNYKRYLNCTKLRAFGNIGHGNINGILLWNGETLSSTYFDNLQNNSLAGLVNYYNSCQVHNNPLEPSIMSAGTRTYIGGNINLGIGTSEEVFKCFWNAIMIDRDKMGDALNDCEDDLYPTSGAHGISGSTGFFTNLVPIPYPIPRPTPRPRPIPRPVPRPRPVIR